MRARREIRVLALALAALGGLLTGTVAGTGAQQEKDRRETGSQKGKALEQRAGRVTAERKDRGAVQIFRGDLIRPMVPEGAFGPAAPEEGSFTLRPGDVLEIECAIPRNIQANLAFKVDDQEIVKPAPMGVRRLVPVSMVGGEPKKITGMIRGLALFQAEKEGQTTIRLDLGLRQFEYKVKVQRGAGD